MNELETRLRAAMQEQSILVASITERCLNLAAEVAFQKEKVSALERKVESLKPEVKDEPT